jgi:EAL domain-containing protein (putative c-di-GMP-specific phosphodiesterase class I)
MNELSGMAGLESGNDIEMGAVVAKDSDFNMEEEFKKALENRELHLHYQPIFYLDDGNIFGFEALMRWEHPMRGNITPGEFIPVAEESGLIIEASQWVLTEACKALNRIEAHAGDNMHYLMSVNFSATDFAEENFLEHLYNVLSRTDVAPNRVNLEITENLILSQPENAKATLDLCRRAGMGIAIDDFGLGDTTIEFLENYPFNILKIDRKFISKMLSDPDTKEFVRNTIKDANAINVLTVAEGVETKEELEALKEMGCNTAQGYYLAKPMPEAKITELLSNWENMEI